MVHYSLIGLALMHIRRSIELNKEKTIDCFSKSKRLKDFVL